jgi:hypothetical protein
MASRASCGTTFSVVYGLGLLLAGCRGETTPKSEPPRSVASQEAEPKPSVSTGEVPAQATETPLDGTEHGSTTRPSDDAKALSQTVAEEVAPVPGPPLSREAVASTFRQWWATFSPELAGPESARRTLDDLVKAGSTPREEDCAELAEHVRQRAPFGSPQLLHGDPSALEGRTDRCWWLHHDGFMGPGLGAALASDGRVLAVWVVLEG